MPISSTENRKTYFGNGVTTVFPFSYYFLEDTDLTVIKTEIATNSETLLALSTDYTVTGAGNENGGSVIITPAVSSAYKVTIYRDPPLTQEVDFQNNSALPASQLERPVDKLTMIVQRLRELMGRSARLSDGDVSGADVTLPTPSALKGIRWNADGTALENYDIVIPTGAVVSASVGVEGISPRASLAQVDAGTEAAAHVTPETLANSALTGRVTTAEADILALQAAGAVIASPVRQTVLSGPVDNDGLPNFGGSTGSSTVTATGTIVATAANGTTDYVGSITDPSWTSLTSNGTMYLYLTIAADGTCTPGAGTQAPTYRPGGADVVTSNQFTFNIQQMVGKLGNGATASQVYRVYVGEVTVVGNVVTAIKWYTIQGRYVSPFTATLPGAATVVAFATNLGTNEIHVNPQVEIECTTINNGYAVGDRVRFPSVVNAAAYDAAMQINITSRNVIQIATGSAASFTAAPKTGGTLVSLTATSWKYRLIAPRGW